MDSEAGRVMVKMFRAAIKVASAAAAGIIRKRRARIR